MTTQILEAIPEETVTLATPERVISDVPKTKSAAKHPGRVAAGKRLAEHNHKVREAKKNKLKHKGHLQAHPQRETQAQQQTQQNNQATTLVTIFLGLVV